MNNQQEKTSLINQFLLLFNDKNNTQIKQHKQYTPDKSTNYMSSSDFTKITQISPLENKYKQENNNNILLTNNIKYGIDESGNPINIKEYYKSINDSVILNSNTSIFSGITSMTSKLKKPIAYITKDENNNNILIDLKGNKITSKNKDGDYDFPLELHVIIKDFDVKHPELRVNGERYYKDDVKEEIDITKEINEKENKFDENINNNYKNENYTLNEELYINNIKKNLLDRKNTNNYFENKFLTKYNNINRCGSNDNNVIMRTSDILNNSNSLLTPNYIKNSPKLNYNYSNNPEKKIITKNRIFMSPILRSNTSNLISLKYKKDLSNNHKIDNELRNRMQAIKCSLSINNIKSKLITKNNESINNKKYKYRNKKNKGILNQKLYTDTYNNNGLVKYIYPNIIEPKKMNTQNRLNRNLNNNKYIFCSPPHRSERNNIYKTQSQNYFLVQHNKSFTNSQLNKKNEKKEEKMNQTIKKKSIIIPINNKTNNNVILDLKKKSKDYNNIKKKSNSTRNKVQNKKRKVENKNLCNKIKKIPSKTRIEYIQKNKLNKLINQEKYYILSDEANDMIKSFSKRKENNEKNLNKNSESAECSNKCKPSIYKYQKLINKENNQINFNNSYFSFINKNNFKNKEEKESISGIQSVDNINKKYLGITVSLPNNQNNKNKTIKTSTNNQININFTPYQIQCESLIKNNADTNAQHNHFIKKNLNGFKGKNKCRIKKNCISPNYEIYL